MDISTDVLQTIRQSLCRDCADIRPWKTCSAEAICSAFQDECREMQVDILADDYREGVAREEAGV